MDLSELAFTSAIDLAARIRTKDVSPVEVVDGLLERIERLNPTLNAFCLGARRRGHARRPARPRQPSSAATSLGRSTACRSPSRTR